LEQEKTIMTQIQNEVAPRHIVTSPAVVDRLLLTCGVVGPVLFNGAYLVEGATRPGYEAWRQAVSALSLGDGGWMQITNFIVFGLLIGCFAAGLRAALVPGVGATWAPLLQGLVALGLVVAGVFVQDPTPGYPPGALVTTPSVHGLVHLFATILTLTARAAWCFVMARRFAREPLWRGWATYSIATGILMMVFLAAFGMAMADSGPAGLFERLALIVTSLLTALLAVRLLAGKGRVSPKSQVSSHAIF
jgi:Protein of unknown function (DUF998)